MKLTNEIKDAILNQKLFLEELIDHTDNPIYKSKLSKLVGILEEKNIPEIIKFIELNNYEPDWYDVVRNR